MRYLRLYAYFVRFSFSRAMEFRVDFFFRVGMDALWYLMHLGFFGVIYRHTTELGGWTFDQAIVFTASMFVVDAVHMTVFSNNMWWFPLLVNRGDLDYYLVRPVRPLFFLSLRDFAANSFLNLVMAAGIFAWALARVPGGVGAGSLAGLLCLLACGIVVGYVVHMLFLVPVFWMQSGSSLRDVHYALHEFSVRPHRVYTGWARRILMSILPYAVIVSMPVDAFFSGFPARVVLHVLAVTAGSFCVLVWFWGRGLRAYSSASS